MSGKNSDALRQRWADPAYRERQTEANRAAVRLPRVLSKRKGKTMDRAKLFEIEAARLQQACQNAQALADQYRVGLDTCRAGAADLEAEIARLKAELAGQLKSRASVVAVQHGATKRANGMEAEVAGLKEEVVKLSRALIDYENWIVAAEPLVPFGLPASFGQWRRP